MTDPIADMLTRVRNALQARHESVEIPASKEKIEIAASKSVKFKASKALKDAVK